MHRVANFAGDGAFAGEIVGLRENAGDIAADAQSLIVIESSNPYQLRLRRVVGGSFGPVLAPKQPFDAEIQLPMAPARFITSTQAELGALTGSGIRPLNGLVSDPTRSAVPLGGGKYLPMTFGMDGDRQFFEFTNGTQHRYRFEDRQGYPLEVGNLTVAVTENAIHLAVNFTDRDGGGANFYLHLDRLTGKARAVHMPRGELDASFQDRYLATSGEQVYWMTVEADAVTISKQP